MSIWPSKAHIDVAWWPNFAALVLTAGRATKVCIPKITSGGTPHSPEVYTTNQIERFYTLAKDEGEVYHILLQLCYYGGLRLSEALGLRWQNVDWDKGEITIDHQLVYDKNTHITHIGPTKSKTERKFDAPPALLVVLQNWKAEQEENEKRLGQNYKANEELIERSTGKVIKGGDFVLRDVDGKLLTHSKASHVRERIQKKTGLHFYYHGLRHTVVSRLAGSGVPVKNISTYIGHSDTRTTEQYYLGVDEIGNTKLAAAIADL